MRHRSANHVLDPSFNRFAYTPFLDFKSTVALLGHTLQCISHLPCQCGADDPEDKQLKGPSVQGHRKL
jgi:hypothetical protein